MKKRMLLLGLVLLLGLGVGAWAVLGRNAAANMTLTKTEGTVEVSDGEGKDLSPRKGLRLYDGYQVGTRRDSFAWIDLDSVKLAKLDERSEVVLQKDGKELELSLRSGSVFFNVTEPLGEDESLTIRTSTMAVGIRGTCGWVDADSEISRVYILEGTVRCQAKGTDTVNVTAGEMAVLEEDGGTIDVAPFSLADIPGYVLDEVDESLTADLPTARIAATGAWGEDITWMLTEDGTLTFSGTGALPDKAVIGDDRPWLAEGLPAVETLILQEGIVSIGYADFYDHTQLKSVSFPSSLITIGREAFESCTSLENIEFPSNLREIEFMAFYECNALTEVTFPSSLKVLANNAFWKCEGLTTVRLPSGMTELNRYAFSSCENLKDICFEGTEEELLELLGYLTMEWDLAEIHYGS